MSNKWELLQLFSSEGSFLIVNKVLLQELGPEKALFISNLVDKYRYFLQQDKVKDGWFFQSHENQIKAIGITEYSIRQCKKYFQEMDVLTIQKKGLPAREWYQLNLNNLLLLIKNKSVVPQDLSISIPQETTISSCDKDNKDKDNKNSFSKEKENVSEETLLQDKSLFKEENEFKEQEIDQDQEEFIICKQVKDLISYWNSKGKPLINHKDKETETYKKIKINLIEVLNDYSVIKVKQSIDHYYNLLTNKSTVLKPGKKAYPISLNLFLKFNSYSLIEIKKFNPEFKVKSWFKECLKSEKELLDKYTVLKPNKYPDMTEYLKDRFEEEFKPKKSFTVNDENSFIEAAKRINKFIDENNVPDKFVRAPWELIPYLFETVKERNKNKTVTPWNLSADWVYETQLPDYLERINVW